MKKERTAPKKGRARQISLPDPLDDDADLLDDAPDPLEQAAERRIAAFVGGFALFGSQVAVFF